MQKMILVTFERYHCLTEEGLELKEEEGGGRGGGGWRIGGFDNFTRHCSSVFCLL